MSEEVLQCSDCPKTFTLTEKEAAFFVEKGLVKPRRCKECRALKKANRDQGQLQVATHRQQPASTPRITIAPVVAPQSYSEPEYPDYNSMAIPFPEEHGRRPRRERFTKRGRR